MARRRAPRRPPRYKRYKFGVLRNTHDTKGRQEYRAGVESMPTRASSPRATRRSKAASKSLPRPAAAPTEERYRLALESLNYGIYDWDIDADTVHYAPGLRIMLGLSEAELAVPADWMARMHPDDVPRY